MGVKLTTGVESETCHDPAFTISLFGRKIYVITAPNLVSAVQRNYQVIAEDSFVTHAADRLTQIKGEGLNYLRETRNGGKGGNKAISQAMHSAMLGPGLVKMNATMLKNLKPFIDELATNVVPLDLYGWCCEVITVAITDATWGPLNPYKSKELRDSFW